MARVVGGRWGAKDFMGRIAFSHPLTAGARPLGTQNPDQSLVTDIWRNLWNLRNVPVQAMRRQYHLFDRFRNWLRRQNF
jgi:hypothetical protein